MTPDEGARMASLNTQFHGAILRLVAYFTSNAKGSVRPFRLEIGSGYEAKKHYFVSLDQLSDFADRAIIKEQTVVDELQKMRVMLKMYDLNYYAVERQTRRGLRPYHIRLVDAALPAHLKEARAKTRYSRNRFTDVKVFDHFREMWNEIHRLITDEQNRIAALEQDEADA